MGAVEMAQGTERTMKHVERNCRITTSWDDGHPLDWRVAELLAKYSLTGTFYIPRFSHKPVMNRSQISELGNSFEIGAHTLKHVAIDKLSDAEARAQLSGSREWIEQLTGKICRTFCFPGGKFRNRQLALVHQAGYQAARTVELLSIAEPRQMGGLYVVPTTVQAFPHGISAYARNVAKRHSASQLTNFPAAILSKGWVSLAREMLTRAMEHGGVFHLWGHSWEIEERGQWENLETLLETVGSLREKWKSVTNGELCPRTSLDFRADAARVPAACSEEAK